MNKISLFFMFVLFLEGVFGESVSVMKGDSVTLNTGLSEIQKDDVLEWRFGAERLRIAKINKAADLTTIYDDVLGGNFKDRLKLDNRTGSLTITNSRTTDSGKYEVNTITTFEKTFNVTVKVDSGVTPGDSGLSAGQTAGIVVGALLSVAAAAVAVFFFKKKSQVL